MSNYTDALDDVAHGAFCDIAAQGVVGGLLFAGLTAETVAGLLGGLAVSAVSAHLYASYCGRPMPPEERPRRPFTGGQCDNVRYQCAAGATATDSLNGATYQVGGGGLVWGKIHQCELVVDPSTFNTATVIVDGSRDDDILTVASYGSSIDGIHPRYTYSNFYATCVRPDGLPDTCGDPPLIPPPAPPPPNNIHTTINYVTAGGLTINAPVTLRFGLPTIDVNGHFTIPVTINFDNDPTLNIGGDVNFNTGNFTINVGGGKPPFGVGTGDPDNITRPPGTPPTAPPDVPPPDDPPPPKGKKKTYKVIRGVIVTVAELDTSATIIFQGDTPDIFAPSLGNISFLCLVAGAYGWTADIPVKNKRQIISCPWQYGAVEVKGTAIAGASFTLDPIYDEVPVPTFPT